MSLWSVYMLRCGDGSLYTGCTNDLPSRVAKHAAGKGARYTRSRPPVKLVYAEDAADKSAALRREAALKRLTRREKLVLLKSSRGTVTKRATAPKPRVKRDVAATRSSTSARGRLAVPGESSSSAKRKPSVRGASSSSPSSPRGSR